MALWHQKGCGFLDDGRHDDVIRAMRADGHTYRAIARVIGASDDMVGYRAKRIGCGTGKAKQGASGPTLPALTTQRVDHMPLPAMHPISWGCVVEAAERWRIAA